MKRYILAALLLAGSVTGSYAQDERPPRRSRDSADFDHYIGVQMNGLIRQVFNFNNSTGSTAVNPYLLNYNINYRKTGWGLRLGVGYNYASTSNDDGITSSKNKINDLALRVGVEHAFVLSEKWSTGVGIDGVLNKDDDRTTSTVHSFDTTTTDIKTVTNKFGGGAMAWLRYHVTPRVLIGTEAGFYYLSGKQTRTVDVTTSTPTGGFPVITTTETVSKPNVSEGTFTSPLVFYLIVKFGRGAAK